MPKPVPIKLMFIGRGVAQLLAPVKTRYGEVHTGFVTDGFTLPWYLRWFHNPFGRGLEAAIWHDFALKVGRENPHREFYTLLVQAGVPKFKALPMLWAVTAYNKVLGAVYAIPKFFK